MKTRTMLFIAYSIIQVLIVVIGLYLNGCTNPVEQPTSGDDPGIDYEIARWSTIDAWEEVIGGVSKNCRDRSADVMIDDQVDKFPDSCIPPEVFGKNYVGCFLPTGMLGIGGDIIYILGSRTEKQKLDTAVHEFTHLLSNCEFSNGSSIDVGLLTECLALFLLEEDFPTKCASIPGDYFHLDHRLWDDYGPDTVEAAGCSNLEL